MPGKGILGVFGDDAMVPSSPAGGKMEGKGETEPKGVGEAGGTEEPAVGKGKAEAAASRAGSEDAGLAWEGPFCGVFRLASAGGQGGHSGVFGGSALGLGAERLRGADVAGIRPYAAGSGAGP